MPVTRLLVAVGGVEQRLLGEMSGDEVQTDRQAGDETARQRQARQAREVRADRVDIV